MLAGVVLDEDSGIAKHIRDELRDQHASVKTAAEKQDLICELDALVSHLYGLERSDVEHIFLTFHRGWDYKPRLDAVLAHYDEWAGRS